VVSARRLEAKKGALERLLAESAAERLTEGYKLVVKKSTRGQEC